MSNLFKLFSHLLVISLLAFQPSKAVALSQNQAGTIINDPSMTTGMAFSDYNGISLIGLAPPNGATFDVSIVAPAAALKILTKALTLIENESAFSKSQIQRLIKAGPVNIVYDPRYPNKMTNMASVQVALFSPHHYKRAKKLNFLVIVSRHGIKWPIRELAAVMVHELVGHGIQHLNNRWGEMRLIDMECEAWLYEEMAYQSLKMDKFSSVMIEFKKQLEKQCASFLRHLRKNDPKGAKLWEVLNPNVPELLKHFEPYLKTQ